MLQLLSFDFIQNALIASVLLSVVTGLIGTYIVSRRQVFLSGGITHASFGGIGIAWFFGVNPIVGASLFAVATSLGLEHISRKDTIREDSAIGILWSFGMAIGILFIFLTPGYAPNLMSYLFGSILTISATDITLLAILASISVLFFILFYHPILFFTFDRNYATTQHAPVKFIGYTLSVLVSLAIVFSIRAVGIVLLLSILTIPANIANQITQRFNRIILLSTLISFIGILAGIGVSYGLNVPSGATIILTLIILYAITYGIKTVKKILFKQQVRDQANENR